MWPESATPEPVQDEHGFTLIELLVVLAIIGVLLAIAVPAYLHFTERARQSAAAADVREATYAAETFFSDNQTYNGISAPQLKLIDSGLSPDLRTVKAENGGVGYCISADVGSWWAHVDGPGGQVVTNETADNCP
jgi:prepilin-type N-terminal cleavage/methylation domain-containing protein